MTRTTYPAELVFVERLSAQDPGWTGRLFNRQAIDRKTGRPFGRFIARIDYVGDPDRYGLDPEVLGHLMDGRPVYKEAPYLVTRQARSRHARRYDHFETLGAAQASLIKWAARNFMVVVDPEPVR